MAQCVFFIVTLCMSRAYYHTETICVLYALSHGDSAESKSYILNSCSVLSSLFLLVNLQAYYLFSSELAGV